MEIQRRKQIIYIGNEINDVLENIINESNDLRITSRYINEYNLNTIITDQIHSFNGINILIIDNKSVTKSTSESEIIKALTKIRDLYDLRIIYIAEGYKRGSQLLSNIFDLGIYNIITAENSKILEEELRKALSEEGMSFRNSKKFKLENVLLNINSTNKVVEKKIIKAKQYVSVGVAGTQTHIGTTTQAIMMTKFLVDSCNTSACYVEYNNHKFVDNFIEWADEYFENIGKVSYQNIDMFQYKDNIKDIVKNDYSINIYDYGNFQEMSDEQIASFLEKDIKFVVSGTKKWEEDQLFEVFSKVGESADINYIFNFVPEEEKELFRKSMQEFNSYFSEYSVNPFVVKNKTYYEEMFKNYICDSEIEKKKQPSKINFKRLFKKGS